MIDYLFKHMNPAHYGANPKRRTILIDNYVSSMASDMRLAGPEFEKAHEIMIKWADLEKSGKLAKMNETNLEGEFLTDVFGKALGYTLFSENLDAWTIQQKFGVNGGEADAAIGNFEHGQQGIPKAIIEFKGPTCVVDRDRSNGRTAIQQCWDYLYNLPGCNWGIVCNYVSFRLYHRDATPRAYELFVLQELRDKDIFKKFYCLFQFGAFFASKFHEARNDLLFVQTQQRDRKSTRLNSSHYS